MRDVWLSLLILAWTLLALGLGALSALSFGKLASARWLTPLEPRLRALSRLVFWAAPLFVLLFFARARLYEWARPEQRTTSYERLYLDPLTFGLRNLLYFACWWILAWRLQTGRQKSGALPLTLILFTGTFAAVDWLESLNLHWHSSAFGLVFVLSALLATHGFLLSLKDRAESPARRRDLNSVHFTLIAVWSYVTFMQYLIVWTSNLPGEADMFTAHTRTSWRLVALALIVFQFALPLLLLVVRQLKESARFTRELGASTLICQVAFLLWVVLPLLHPAGVHLSIANVIALAVLLGLWAWNARRLA